MINGQAPWVGDMRRMHARDAVTIGLLYYGVLTQIEASGVVFPQLVLSRAFIDLLRAHKASPASLTPPSRVAEAVPRRGTGGLGAS